MGLPPMVSQGALRAAGPRGQEETAAEAIHPGAQPGECGRENGEEGLVTKARMLPQTRGEDRPQLDSRITNNRGFNGERVLKVIMHLSVKKQ